ncbi:MAG TPA: hypothetical protein VIG76_05485 [Amnibacterium sp.]|jgi:hypothetical protein|uniref:hypothetical protein n=1 Tax=Amnibacterium sp. TaxID=1872496 RepID=UPI002F9511B2
MSEAADGNGVTAEELRRRLYDADATEQDHARYRAALEAEGQPQPAPASADEPADAREPDPAPDRPHRRRTLTILAAVVGAVAILGALVALQPRGQASPVDPPPSPSTIAVDDAARTEFLQNLGSGGSAGIAAFLVTHRAAPQLGRVSRLFLVERHGRGPGSVTLEGVPKAADQGRATVFLVTQFAGPAGWSAYRAGLGSESQGVLDASRAGAQEGGVPTMATFRYPNGDRPVKLTVDVPDGVRWGIAVAFSD